MPMLAMQYTIKLPRDYDPAQLQKRVEDRSALFDTLPGLVHKSFLFNEESHIYAPFYIWDNLSAAKAFLLDDLFKGVIESFNRPRVRTWAVLDMAYGNKAELPTFAVQEVDTVPTEQNLQRMVAQEQTAQATLLKNPNLHFHMVALDADRWEVVRYSLWKDRAAAAKSPADCVFEYDILHVCEPGA